MRLRGGTYNEDYDCYHPSLHRDRKRVPPDRIPGEAEFGHEWDGNIKAYILNAAEDESATLEAMAREYTGAIHDLPDGAIVLAGEDGRPLECYWVEEA
ncbi:MAG: hypothetical protein ACLU9S_22215 [Oscillospiraceae bacterium]